MKNLDEADGRPIASSLLQEFQNLKDKFKNEDEMQERGEGDIGNVI